MLQRGLYNKRPRCDPRNMQDSRLRTSSSDTSDVQHAHAAREAVWRSELREENCEASFGYVYASRMQEALLRQGPMQAALCTPEVWPARTCGAKVRTVREGYAAPRCQILWRALQDAVVSKAWLLPRRSRVGNARGMLYPKLRGSSSFAQYVPNSRQESVEVRESACRSVAETSKVFQVLGGLHCAERKEADLSQVLRDALLLPESRTREGTSQRSARAHEASDAQMGQCGGDGSLLRCLPSRMPCRLHRASSRPQGQRIAHDRESSVFDCGRQLPQAQSLLARRLGLPLSFKRQPSPASFGAGAFSHSLNRCAPSPAWLN